jgi:hypothetical protein
MVRHRDFSTCQVGAPLSRLAAAARGGLTSVLAFTKAFSSPMANLHQ